MVDDIDLGCLNIVSVNLEYAALSLGKGVRMG